MVTPRYPLLLEIDALAWLDGLSRSIGRAATLDDIEDAELDRLAALGFDWIACLGVWPTAVAPSAERPADAAAGVDGPHAGITRYTVQEALGGEAALARLRDRLHSRGLKLMLDFAVDQVASSHPWVTQHPEFFFAGDEADPRPFNFGRSVLQQALMGELQRIAGQCDGLRCNQALRGLPEVFLRRWGLRSEPFWPKAMAAVRHLHPAFEFLAEIDTDGAGEWQGRLQQQGFDHVCDAVLYQRLRNGAALPLRDHLQATAQGQQRMARFLEAPGVPPATVAFASPQHEAAAVLCYATPGLRLWQPGLLPRGGRVQSAPRANVADAGAAAAAEVAASNSAAFFFRKLLAVLRHDAVRNGVWSLLECGEAWSGNPTAEDFIVGAWQQPGRPWVCVAVNYAAHASQCYVRLPALDERGSGHAPTQRLTDLLGAAVYERPSDDLAARGLYLDLPAWGHHVFEVTAAGP